MIEFLANLTTLVVGVIGGAIGFILGGVILVILFVPVLFYVRDRAPARHSGLSRFAASLDHPDEGVDDRIPGVGVNSPVLEK